MVSPHDSELNHLFYGIKEFWSPKRKTKIKQLNKFLEPNSTFGRWLPVFLWAAIIFSLSSLPQTKVSEFFLTDFIVKKTAHITEYAILYFLLYRATKKRLFLSLVLAILYAASDEFHQRFSPGRTPRLYDVFGFDLTGANIAGYILWKLSQTQKKKPKN